MHSVGACITVMVTVMHARLAKMHECTPFALAPRTFSCRQNACVVHPNARASKRSQSLRARPGMRSASTAAAASHLAASSSERLRSTPSTAVDAAVTCRRPGRWPELLVVLLAQAAVDDDDDDDDGPQGSQEACRKRGAAAEAGRPEAHAAREVVQGLDVDGGHAMLQRRAMMHSLRLRADVRVCGGSCGSASVEKRSSSASS